MNFSNITWLDDKGHIKPPLMLYLMLVFLARGWCIFIASLTQASDRAGLVALVYPQKSDFLMALMAGAGALIVYGLIIAERKRSPSWIQPIFKYIKWLLLALLCIDGGLLIQRILHAHYVYSWSVGLDALFLFWSTLYLFNSNRLKYYFLDWKAEE
ncbi:Conserved hypothetical protein [Shewanella piezotolerans WP3]|uniref:DUF2919 domain-containing protein n=1 Tax=Shewanella piezotolerans (strain WP3 / JCM 13877) TaxID=225849 RepID=B8CN92_SHEPW|nr:DUF2919 domain-containing protein [Shewanella piezotolerans]ACJ28726.1 Conserved hypothetical protein [Shewanella piezotolerans WP3]